jgi:hypothetical protein
MKFGLKICARISLKNLTLYRKHNGNEIKELEPMKAYKYWMQQRTII